MNSSALATSIGRTWEASIVPQLVEYIRIPAKSPHFDPRWEEHGHIERVIGLAEAWVRQQPVRGMTLEIVRLPGRTPVLFFDVAGSGRSTVLLYGHLDKQPPMVGWRDGLGAWTPYFDADGRLYGRGAADDGYAVFTALATVKALKDHGQPHGRIVVHDKYRAAVVPRIRHSTTRWARSRRTRRAGFRSLPANPHALRRWRD